MSVIEWGNAGVQIQHVPVVRRVMAANDNPEVVMVGALGEINSLVGHHITDEFVRLLESWDGSKSDSDVRIEAVRSLELRIDILQQYVGRNLLRARLTMSLSCYELTIDLENESIVTMSGFTWRDPKLKEPANGSLVECVCWTFDNYPGTHRVRGERVVEMLLTGRDPAALTSDELQLLAKGYNWCNLNDKAFEVAKYCLSREPESSFWLSRTGMYLRNAYLHTFPQFLTACDQCIVEKLGSPVFWHLMKADYFVEIAVGEFEREEYEWSPGDEILHPELLRLAAESMETALACEPGIREKEAWNERFAALLQVPEYQHLAM